MLIKVFVENHYDTFSDIWIKLDELFSLGFYFIDPNGGGRDDAILAHCNFDDKMKKNRVETCVYPQQSTYEVKDWVPNGSDRVTWFMGDIQTTFNDKVSF